MKIGNSEFRVVTKNGSIWVDHIFGGAVVDTMKVYDVYGKPYCKRLSEKMYLPEELLNDTRLIAAH